MKMNLRTFTRLVTALFAVSLICACEDDSGGPGDGHDFGDNDPNVHSAIGDSITYGWGAGTSYPAILSGILGKTVINRGSPGAPSGSGVSAARSAVANDKPGYLLIMYGSNDAIHGYDVDSTIGNLQAMIQTAKANKTIPIIATVPAQIGEHGIYNGRVNAINEKLVPMAKAEGCSVANVNKSLGTNPQYFQGDGLHPNAEGQRVIANTFADVIQ